MADATALKRAGRKVRAVLDVAAKQGERPSVDVQLANVRAIRQERKRRRTRRNRVVAAMSLCAAFALAMFFVRRGHELSFTIDGTRADAGAWVSAGAEDAQIAFSEGSRIVLHPAGHARIVSLTEHGAEVLLERGSLSAAVVHRDRSDWRIVGGPFEVHVVGTQFDTAWDPASEVLSVHLVEGRVEVTGACLREPRPIRTGESIRLSCKDVVASEAPTSSVAMVVPPPASSDRAPSPSSSVVRADEPSWRDLANKGDYPGAFAAADRQGIDGIIASGSVSDLSQLSDVARLAKQAGVARRIALSLRERFPGTDAAANAAFQLGRMGDAGHGEAERWLEVYLSERPTGAFEQEALGRLLELQHSGGQDEAAKATAAQYLARHPDGAHADLARSIVAP